jgi:hypothetical protein
MARQLVAPVLPERPGQREARLEDPQPGPLSLHPLVGVVGLAGIAAKHRLSERGTEPLSLREYGRQEGKHGHRPEG